LRFERLPGKFSPLAQHAAKLAIERVAAAANMDTIDWTVSLTFPYPGMTMYGESLAAMVGLSVVALAKGEAPISGLSITGTITEDGHIGKVGGVPEKIYGAHRQHLNRILIPEEHHIGDGDWPIPFLMHVSPVSTVEKAYLVLTGRRLSTSIN
jgi:predicted S18 family serine protease